MSNGNPAVGWALRRGRWAVGNESWALGRGLGGAGQWAMSDACLMKTSPLERDEVCEI